MATTELRTFEQLKAAKEFAFKKPYSNPSVQGWYINLLNSFEAGIITRKERDELMSI